MQEARDFNGVWTALLTPFCKDLSIDNPAWEALIERQNSSEVTGVVVAGSTGEGSSLSVHEKLSLIKRAKASLSGKIRLMANVGGSDTRQTVEVARLAQDAGADSLLVVTPPYLKPSLRGLALHFSSIAKAVSIPICLYHVPGRTAQSLSVAEMQDLCDIDRVATVKEASGDIGLLSEFITSCQASFLSGDDLCLLPGLAVGAIGVVSVAANLIPDKLCELYSSYQRGELAKATSLHQRLVPLFKGLFVESNPSPIKALSADLGLCQNILRPPLATASKSSTKVVLDAYRSVITEF